MITPTWPVRRLHALDDPQIDELAGVLIDCVEDALLPHGGFCSTTVYYRDLVG